jgi:hypothetical protein
MGQLVFQATLGGQVNLVGPNTASTFNINVPAVAGNMVTTGDTGTVTNTMLAGSIANAKLTNSSVTIGSTNVDLGATAATIAGLTLTSPALGTPSSGVLTNCTGLPQSGLAAGVAGNGPAFGAYQSTPQALSSGVFTNIQCQTENFDTGGCFNNTGSTVTLNGISTPAYAFAPNVAGYYQINLHINCTSALPYELITSVYKNGSSVSYVSDVIGAATRSSNGSYLIYLNGTSDYIQFYGYINTNINISIAFFQAFMVRAA